MIPILFILLFNFIHSARIENLCSTRPADCSIICPYGYLRELKGRCVCACASNPCLAIQCAPQETCLASGPSARCVAQAVGQRSECPRLSGGVCALRCLNDDDCQGRLICCSNGCGRECVVPMNALPIKAVKGIEPLTRLEPKEAIDRILSAVRVLPEKLNAIIPYTPPPPSPSANTSSTKSFAKLAVVSNFLGECPALRDDHCNRASPCRADVDCTGFQKCCSTSCGAICMDPVKTTACIHLHLAVAKLPKERLQNGYLPSCDSQGKFRNIQCDNTHCWCVDVNYGEELPGSRVMASMRRHDMCISTRKCTVQCRANCPHGFKMDEYGCPVSSCKCKDICADVACPNPSDSCQLVEPDCATPPCLPIPRCLLNPCPNGSPMTLPNGVTALCAQSSQCTDGFWCHQIGYNGLGFCCSGIERRKAYGICPTQKPLRRSGCSAKCKWDDDCANGGKCCFDGCGLECINFQEPTEPPRVTVLTTPAPFTTTEPMTPIVPVVTSNSISPSMKRSRHQPGDVVRHNKDHLTSLVADCPILAPKENCTMQCRADADCQGMKRCCRAGCGTTCTYFERSTPCFQLALSAELYNLRTAMKCDTAGNYERTQCDDDGCFCVDVISGEELPGTRIPGKHPKCEVRKKCDVYDCQSTCLHGYEKDLEGCPTCRCVDPCKDVKCSQGSSCIMSSVECYQRENCPQQPRCIVNLCPSGQPAPSPLGSAEICSIDSHCPSGYWCHDIGFSSGGICCRSPRMEVKLGTCPPTMFKVTQDTGCRIDCRSDEDCDEASKCCFNGCGTTCLPIAKGIKKTELKMAKQGLCPKFDQSTSCGSLENDHECSSDSHCEGTQKCCNDGCRRICVYPEKNSTCIIVKNAYQQLGEFDVKCRPDGSYEPVQCDHSTCWCVDQTGYEIEGTRTSEDIMPNCEVPRRCPVPLCTTDLNCKFGLKKDSNGCNTCECRSVCEHVTCPSTAFCIPIAVDCPDRNCPDVPRCVINPCPIGTPQVDPSSFDPIACKINTQCVSSKSSSSYCQLFRHDGGYCCPGPEPRQHPGVCPRADTHSSDCERNCVLDEQCAAGEKCCSNGCGLSCRPAEFDTSVHPTGSIGQCIAMPSLGAFCSQRDQTKQCATDRDCPDLFKCCSDGCSTKCTPPAMATQCIHARIGSLILKETNPTAFVPQCEHSGEFSEIQQHYGLQWCVDGNGNEVPGTKTTQVPNCRFPKSCPVRSCAKHCQFGFKTDNDGCVVCDCRSPCDLIECEAGYSCMLVTHACSKGDCQPIPRCVPNACPLGDPLVDEETNTLVKCDYSLSENHAVCPIGYECHHVGYMGKGFCCQSSSKFPASSVRCPPVFPSNSSTDGSACVVACRQPHDCINAICCFNGCGTSCQFETDLQLPDAVTGRPVAGLLPQIEATSMVLGKTQPIRPKARKPVIISQIVEEKPPRIIPQTHQISKVSVPQTTTAVLSKLQIVTSQPTQQKIGVCPEMLLNPGCQEECHNDFDCPGFLKCCKASCAAVCAAPIKTTSCVHQLLAFQLEHPQIPPAVQCTSDGLFRRHQCDARIQHCWCVEEATGREIFGTRISSNLPLPECSQPRPCAITCAPVAHMCRYGIRIGENGCPANDICSCRNPCDEVNCLSAVEMCAMVEVECLTQFCPAVPKCIPNLCGLNQMQQDDLGNPKTCKQDHQCMNGRCAFEKSEAIGMCCRHSIVQQVPLQMPAEAFTTNCTILRDAFEDLYNSGAVVDAFKPQCSEITGLFEEVQQDPSGNSWCVEEFSGIEILGTRTRSPHGKDVCKSPRKCPFECSSTVCAFGLELDRYGCPRPECRCFSPCDGISCPGEKICMLKVPECNGSSCQHVPVCVKSPCFNGNPPASDSISRRPFACELGHSICPTGFYCLAISMKDGVCCPGRTPQEVKKKNRATCTHGDPFYGHDGRPFKCTALSNGCPSSHYCSTNPGEKTGICCISKRYVCNLASDSGPCSLNLTRFYYSATDHVCRKFEYGGCSGNLNNFATEMECNRFCEGIGIDINIPLSDNDSDTGKETIQLGFMISGPRIPDKNKLHAERLLQNALAEQFNVPKTSLGEVRIKPDNTVRFTISHAEARDYARTISQLVASGKLRILIDENSYQAEPQTWYAHQVESESEESVTAKYVLFGSFVAAGLCAVVILSVCFIVCCCLIRSQPKSSSRTSSPCGNYATNSIFAHQLHHEQQPQQQQQQQHSRPMRRESIFSRSSLHTMPRQILPRPSFRSVVNQPEQGEYC